MKISNKLKKARRDKKLTQEYVASQINVSRKTISSWENGRGRPNSLYLKQLNSIYDTKLQLHYTHNHNKNNKYFYIIYFINLILFVLCLVNIFTGLLEGIAALQLIFILFFCVNYRINILTKLKISKTNILIYFILFILIFIIIMNNLETKYIIPNLLINILFYIGAMIHSLILTSSFFIITNYRKGKY